MAEHNGNRRSPRRCLAPGQLPTGSKQFLSLVLLACGTSMAAAPSAAATRWRLEDGGNGHLYVAATIGSPGSPVSWDNARAAARARGPGWDLATITSAEENAFVKSLFETRPALIREFTRCADPDICWYRIGPWIGGFNVTELRQFQWVTGEPVSFTDWGVSTFGGPGQQVAYLGRYFNSTFGWSTPHPGLYPIAYVAELTTDWASLVLKQSTVAGCKAVTGTVAISQPAPPEGLVVNLSDTLNSARMPATLTIPAGATSAAFTIRTSPVASSETGTVRATFGSTALNQPLTVRPMELLSLSLSPSAVVGGSTVTGRATLECKAAPVPVTVDLESNHPALASPVAASIIIPQGLQSDTFDVTTHPVQAQRSVSITVSANGSAKSRTLRLNPAASVGPTKLKFGNVLVYTGRPSTAQNVTLYNKGTTSFSITGIEFKGRNAPSYLRTHNCPVRLAAGTSCTIGVRMWPKKTGVISATLSIGTSATSSPLSVWVSGTGI